MGKSIDITGKIFGKLTAIECVEKDSKGVEIWKCKCECGNEATIKKHNLTRKKGQTKSCGCLMNPIRNDLTGQVFGRLTVLEYAGSNPRNISMWKCKCECGEEIITRSTNLTTGTTKSCGCIKKGRQIEDLTGKVFGRLTVLEYVGKDQKSNISMWKCKCECGEETITRSSSLKDGVTKSCGCLYREVASTINFKHGLYKHHLYKTWTLMRNRCNNPNADVYKDYGGRGIKVCDEWNKSFEAFHRDMAHTHKEGLTLERIDVNGDYTPENCKWATRLEQSNNTRVTRFITVFGEKMTLTQAAEKYNINRKTLYHRIHVQDLLPEDAVTLPVKKVGRGAK